MNREEKEEILKELRSLLRKKQLVSADRTVIVSRSIRKSYLGQPALVFQGKGSSGGRVNLYEYPILAVIQAFAGAKGVKFQISNAEDVSGAWKTPTKWHPCIRVKDE